MRVAEPGWDNPLDVTHSARAGGRWNAPGTEGVLYLNASDRLARLQVDHRLDGMPFGPEDLDVDEQHDLVEVDVERCQVLDCVTPSGLAAVGLPSRYPRHGNGRRVSHLTCQPIGAAARAAGLSGVACRSAAKGASERDEELALFDAARAHLGARTPFAEWYFAAAGVPDYLAVTAAASP